MSDFDKEAEREKLREKYEREQEKREATEQMSELLLKGATMTNAHCGTCGDPIFRYDGQEFCPTCEEVVTERDEAPDEETGDETTGDGPDPDGSEADDGDGERPAGDAAVDTPAGSGTDATAADANGASTAATATHREAEMSGDAPTEGTSSPTDPSDGRDRDRATTRDVPSADPDRSGDTAGPVSTAPETVDGAEASLATARASLTRTVTRLAKEAEQSGDLERVRAYLAATAEAAEALDAVKRADE